MPDDFFPAWVGHLWNVRKTAETVISSSAIRSCTGIERISAVGERVLQTRDFESKVTLRACIAQGNDSCNGGKR